MELTVFQTPILVIAFNRPRHMRRVLEAIMAVRPQELYVFQDGAREGNESDRIRCEEVRQVVNELTNGTQVRLHTNYSEVNLGCGPGPYEAMSWFFRNVEKGIVLEDDIVPHPLFFSYMDDLLERYKNNDSVGMVTAHNLQRHYSRRNSYYFTFEMAGTLGWGTWRRVWENFDFDIPYNDTLLDEALKSYGIPKLCRKKSLHNFEKWLSGTRHDCWDYQFDYYLLVNRFLNARPNSCLTSHEDDGEEGTHSGYSNPGYRMEVNTSLFQPITHPKSVKVDSSVKWRMWKKEAHRLVKKLLKRD